MNKLVRLAKTIFCVSGLAVVTCVPVIAAESSFGVLLMAHGGSAEWNETVQETVEPLQQRFPVEIAFGMADAVSLEAGIRKLEQQGVSDIGVVRMFISEHSWLERTRQILGLEEGAPPRPSGHGEGESQHSSGHRMEFWRIDSDARFALSREGLANAREVEGILLDRARQLSRDPAEENLIVIAHGTSDDQENAQWIEYIKSRTRLVSEALSFNDIEVFTLREDWKDKREAATAEIRSYLEASRDNGKRALVLPFRVQGFGPYEEVLTGLPYEADKIGLTPHENIVLWIERQAEILRRQLQES